MAKRTRHQLRRYMQRFFILVRHPFFWLLTGFGNSMILIGSILLYIFEHDAQNHQLSFLDCLLWGTGIVTTVGYSNAIAATTSGKLTVLVLMFCGTVFVWSYMAFLVTGLLAPELSTLEKNMIEMEKDLLELKPEGHKPPG